MLFVFISTSTILSCGMGFSDIGIESHYLTVSCGVSETCILPRTDSTRIISRHLSLHNCLAAEDIDMSIGVLGKSIIAEKAKMMIIRAF